MISVNIRFPVLSALSRGPVEYYSLLNSLDGPPHLCADLLVQMGKEDLISGSRSHGSYVSLTTAGSALLLQLLEDQRTADAARKEQQAKEQATETARLEEHKKAAGDQRAQKKKDRILDFAKLLLGGVITLVVQYLIHRFGL